MPVVGFDVNTQRILADGKSWGEVGPYEELLGTLHFATDPLNGANSRITDGGLARRSDEGMVEFTADVSIILPVERSRGTGKLLLDVVNRGNRVGLPVFNSAPGVAIEVDTPKDYDLNLAQTLVELAAHSPGDVGYYSVEGFPARFVSVEVVVDVGSKIPSGLGDSIRIGVPNVFDDVTADELRALIQRLQKMGSRGRSGSWTAQMLTLIDANPIVASSQLAPTAGMETKTFKASVRKLKRLGLTISYETGYGLTSLDSRVLSSIVDGGLS